MKNKKIFIDEAAARSLAEKRFIQTCGFDLEREKHQRMMKMGLKVREDGIAGIGIKALISFYGPEHFSDNGVVIDDVQITCNYFAQVPKTAVEGIYFYMLTAGECLFSSEENIMDFLYADIWGTNYVDAGIQILTEQHIQKDMEARFSDKQVYLSEEFGPGYFGMPVIETRKFASILDASSIGVRVKESGLMIPQKTCAGFYLVYNRADVKAEPSCMQCYGNADGCQFCAIKAKMKEEA
ncbi:hypothetical protein ACDL92_01710 [Ihubacter sp. mB4P-1]|uniref:hypothetical protein n=1 Tax=Ihubacter sp. mB4P-1 TaxID=3242370 RepID=UPI0013796BD2